MHKFIAFAFYFLLLPFLTNAQFTGKPYAKLKDGGLLFSEVTFIDNKYCYFEGKDALTTGDIFMDEMNYLVNTKGEIEFIKPSGKDDDRYQLKKALITITQGNQSFFIYEENGELTGMGGLVRFRQTKYYDPRPDNILKIVRKHLYLSHQIVVHYLSTDNKAVKELLKTLSTSEMIVFKNITEKSLLLKEGELPDKISFFYDGKPYHTLTYQLRFVDYRGYTAYIHPKNNAILINTAQRNWVSIKQDMLMNKGFKGELIEIGLIENYLPDGIELAFITEKSLKDLIDDCLDGISNFQSSDMRFGLHVNYLSLSHFSNQTNPFLVYTGIYGIKEIHPNKHLSLGIDYLQRVNTPNRMILVPIGYDSRRPINKPSSLVNNYSFGCQYNIGYGSTSLLKNNIENPNEDKKGWVDGFNLSIGIGRTTPANAYGLALYTNALTNWVRVFHQNGADYLFGFNFFIEFK